MSNSAEGDWIVDRKKNLKKATEATRSDEEDTVAVSGVPWGTYVGKAQERRFFNRFPEFMAVRLKEKLASLAGRTDVLMGDVCGVHDFSALGAHFSVGLTLQKHEGVQESEDVPGVKTIVEGDFFDRSTIKKFVKQGKQFNPHGFDIIFMDPVAGLDAHMGDVYAFLKFYAQLCTLFDSLAPDGHMYLRNSWIHPQFHALLLEVLGDMGVRLAHEERKVFPWMCIEKNAATQKLDPRALDTILKKRNLLFT